MYKHYCGENLKEISLFDEVESCHDTERALEMKDDCPFHQHHSSENEEEDNCCTDEYNRIALEDQLKQLDKNQSSIDGLTPSIINLGFQSLDSTIEEDSNKSPYLAGSPINAPPLYILYAQFNFYG